MSKYSELSKVITKNWLYNKLTVEHFSCRGIQDKYGFDERLISRLAKEYSIKSTYREHTQRKNIVTKEDINDVIKLYTVDNLSTIEISNLYNCSSGLIENRLKENNVEMKSNCDIRYYKKRRKKYYERRQTVDNAGYICGAEQRLHREIMERATGRRIAKENVIHHIDGNRSNNIINNLFIFENSSHHTMYHQLINKIYIHPRIFKKYILRKRINMIESEDWLYNKYITENMSMNKISKICCVDRSTIKRRLEKFNIIGLRSMAVN